VKFDGGVKAYDEVIEVQTQADTGTKGNIFVEIFAEGSACVVRRLG
jgi:hypothetical protein